MTNKFTTSINIVRDGDRKINYIPTPNAVRVVNQIANDFKTGIRSFSIIGSYGTGKSAFLWALRQTFLDKEKYFEAKFLAKAKFKFINIVGEYKSLRAVFYDYFNLNDNNRIEANIFSALQSDFEALGKNGILFLSIDEFGKFLEFAAHNEPEYELYFLQQLAEFINNPDNNIILCTTVHQNFDAYAVTLTQTQKQEWTKVKGRFREITFNEPIEQLLFLAAEHLEKNSATIGYISKINEAVKLLISSKAFSLNEEYLIEIAEKLFPLDVISAYILTVSLQKYGQNERSLFSFLESTDQTGLTQHLETKKGFYSISDVYDYLAYNFYTLINSINNTDLLSWKSIRIALDRVETAFNENIISYSKIIKVIGLLNINALAGAKLDDTFLIDYLKNCLGISNAETLIRSLEAKKIILYRNYNKRFILFEGTDIDIYDELKKAGSKIDAISDIVTLLKKYYELPPIVAKRVMYEKGTPRLFEYKISTHPINEIPKDEIDGFVNLIFNPENILEEVISHSAKNEDAILFCYYKNAKAIKDILFEMEKTKKVIADNQEDKIVVRELENIFNDLKDKLNNKILNNFYGIDSEVVWYFRGEQLVINSKREFNRTLSSICNIVYSYAPYFNNELVNKHKISASIHTAKRNYFRALVDNWNKPDLGFESSRFPPEKTIYLTLLKENGIELYSENLNDAIVVDENSSFKHLWQHSNNLLNSTKSGRKTVAAFIEYLSLRPFKLKQGVIDFWIASFLFIKRNDFSLFGASGYIPYLTDEILELVIKYPEEYQIKALDIEGVKLDLFNSYRLFLNQGVKEEMSNHLFVETIKPFLSFYRTLPEYAKNTKRLAKETISLREAISLSKDPEKSFFEDFPNALGYSTDSLQQSKEQLEAYVLKLQEAIKELRSCYSGLQQRFETFITEEFIGDELDFEGFKAKLQKRFAKLKKHLCLPHQKTFVQRLDSKLEDKQAWLNSIAQSVVGKPLESLKDEDEYALYDKFKTLMSELDSLTSLSKEDVDESSEEAFGIEFSSFSEGVKKSFVRLPKTKSLQAKAMEGDIKALLSSNKSLNIVAVTNILKELLQS